MPYQRFCLLLVCFSQVSPFSRCFPESDLFGVILSPGLDMLICTILMQHGDGGDHSKIFKVFKQFPMEKLFTPKCKLWFSPCDLRLCTSVCMLLLHNNPFFSLRTLTLTKYDDVDVKIRLFSSSLVVKQNNYCECYLTLHGKNPQLSDRMGGCVKRRAGVTTHKQLNI